MEPLSALSVAAAVAQFVDFGLKIAGNAREIYGSFSGLTEEDRILEAATRKTQYLTEKLVTSSLGGFTEEETMLNDLVAECRSLSTQLLELLDKFKAKDSKSKMQVALSSWRSRLYEKDKARLKRRLDECQVRLDRLLSALSRSEIKEHLERFIVSSEDKTRDLTLLRKQVQELRAGLASGLTSINPEAREQFQDVFGLSQNLCFKAMQQRILGLLAFPRMRDRVDIVEKAHKATYSWIFGDMNGVKGGSTELSAALLDGTSRKQAGHFVKWLSSGTGIYHIAGKLGSGKSTLMKYLASHSRVREELQKWAGDKKLVVASFFFWRRGTQLQRSLSGLLQSLLYDILEQRPDLIQQVLPDAWQKVRCSPGGVYHSSLARTDDSVQSAFSRLVECVKSYDDAKFFLFIDGLDEYEETTQHDFKAVVQLLSSWTQAAPDCIKLCVSSREYNVFVNFFSPEKQMRLQDLTLADMRRYVQERLQELPQEDLDRIVQVITEKANGIFLWVALVVKSIRARLEDGCGTSMIEDEVNSLPDEMEGLFQHLLASINKPYRKKAYQTFAMIQALPINDERPVRLSLLAYSFLEDYAVGSEFAQRPNPTLFPLTEAARCQRENAARKRLNAHCQGLVELDQETHLRHTHRSVVEFLAEHLKQAPMAESALAEFQPAHAVSQLILAELRCRPRDSYWMDPMASSSPFLRVTMRIRAALVAMLAAGLDVPPYSYLEALRFAANSVIPDHLSRGVMMQKQPPQFASCDYFWDPASVLNECASLGMHGYLEYVTSADPSTFDNNDKVASLAHFEILGVVTNWCQRHGVRPSSYPFGGLAVLLRRGINPNAAIHTNPWTGKMQLHWGATLWEHFVCYLATNAPSLTLTTSAGRVIREFLEQGANPDLRIALGEGRPQDPPTEGMAASQNTRVGRVIQRFEIQRNGPHPRLPILTGSIARPGIRFSFGRGQGNTRATNSNLSPVSIEDIDHVDAETRYYNFLVSKGGEICFEDFVEFCDFENKDVILELCARNRLALGASMKTKLASENEGQNPAALHNTNMGKNEQPKEEVQDSWETDSGIEFATSTETEAAAGSGLVLPRQEESKLEYFKDKHMHEEPECLEPKQQRFKQNGQRQTLYQRLRKSRVVDVTLAILAAHVLSQLLHSLS